MKTVKLVIDSLKCEKTTVELGKDEIYCGGVFIPLKLDGDGIKKGKVISFATDHVSMKKGKTLDRMQISDWNFDLELPDGYDDYLLIVHLMEKDDGGLQLKFKNDDIATAVENVKVWDAIKKKLFEDFDPAIITSTKKEDVWIVLGKLVVKILPTLISGLVQQIKMDDVIASKQLTSVKVAEIDLASVKVFDFNKMFAKYKMGISINKEV